MNDETTLALCPFCGGEAFVRIDTSLRSTQSRYRVGCDKDSSCHGWYGHSRYYATEAEAIAAWNTRAAHGTLTAEQVREAVMSADRWEKPMGDTGLTNTHLIIRDDGWQAIADELNKLGSNAKPCYAADANYERCKYSANRGWCDDAPFLVWDDTGHLFITMGGLKTWDVTADAKKWFAELGSGTCEQVLSDCDDGLIPPFTAHCSACGAEWGFTPKYCHNCGAKVTGTRDERKAVDR